MKKSTLKRSLCTAVLCILVTQGNRTVHCMILPSEQLAAYQALIKTMPDADMAAKYQEYLKTLQAPVPTGADTSETTITQLPVFQLQLLKALIQEVKVRQENGHKEILTRNQISEAEDLIHSSEQKIQHGIAQENAQANQNRRSSSSTVKKVK